MSIFLYDYQGKVDLGYRTGDEALRIAEESGDPYSKATAHTSYGFSCYYKGLLDEAEQHLSKACEFCERLNWFSWHALANLSLGLVYSDRRQHQKAKDCYSKAIYLYESNSFCLSSAYFCKMQLTRANVMNNEKDINLNQIFSYYQDNRLKLQQGFMSKYIGEILLNVDDQHIHEAEDWVKKAIEADEKNGTMFNLGSDYALYAELLKRKGDLIKAKEKMNKAIEIYRVCGADGWLKKAQHDLAAIEKPTRKRSKQTKG